MPSTFPLVKSHSSFLGRGEGQEEARVRKQNQESTFSPASNSAELYGSGKQGWEHCVYSVFHCWPGANLFYEHKREQSTSKYYKVNGTQQKQDKFEKYLYTVTLMSKTFIRTKMLKINLCLISSSTKLINKLTKLFSYTYCVKYCGKNSNKSCRSVRWRTEVLPHEFSDTRHLFYIAYLIY